MARPQNNALKLTVGPWQAEARPQLNAVFCDSFWNEDARYGR
jgi:hypothetical protein